MYCVKCGAKIMSEDTKFCTRCGAQISSAMPMQSIPLSSNQRAAEPVNEVPSHSNLPCPRAAEYFEKATQQLALDEYDFALLSVRKALEAVVKDISKKCGLATSEDDRDLTLEAMIDNLREAYIFADDDISLFHRTRIAANKGAHDRENAATYYDAEYAINLMREVLDLIGEKYDEAFLAEVSEYNNTYMLNPDYYSSTRRYYGKWCYCYTREALEVIPEYCELKRRADADDISAMLDIAVGFLPRQIVWSRNGLVCMPKYRDRDGNEYFQEDAYDARYYYWILKALLAIDQHAANSDSFPRKYAATVFLEGAKFILYSSGDLCNYVTGRVRTGSNGYTLRYECQYDLPERMFGESLADYWNIFTGWIAMRDLLYIWEYSPSSEIIASVHQENTLKRIQYLYYCFAYLCQAPLSRNEFKALTGEEFETTVPKMAAISPGDEGAPYTEALLKQYTDDPVCKRHYAKAQEAHKHNKKLTPGKVKQAKFFDALEATRPQETKAFEISEKQRFTYAAVLFFVPLCFAGLIALPLLSPTELVKDICTLPMLLIPAVQFAGRLYGWQLMNRYIRCNGSLLLCFIKDFLAGVTGGIYMIYRFVKAYKAMKAT